MTRGIFPLVTSNVNVNSPPSRISNGGVGNGVIGNQTRKICPDGHVLHVWVEGWGCWQGFDVTLAFQAREGQWWAEQALSHSKHEREGGRGRKHPLTHVSSKGGAVVGRISN